MRALRPLAAALVSALVVPFASWALPLAPSLHEGAEITIDAEQVTYEERTDTVLAQGNVVIVRGETQLRADEVRLNRTTNEAEAHGHVELIDPQGTITAEALQLDLEDETGWLESASVVSRRMQYSLAGERIEKGLGQSYHIENGRFTTCHCAEGPPSWSVSGRDLRVTLGGYGILQGGTFNVLGRPIAYIPRAIFPVQRERQSGFLLPRFAVSNRRGFQTVIPFYWNIDKSQDATVAVDLETSARAGLVSEYRYALGRDFHGILTGSYFNESFRGAAPGQSFEATVPQNRWSIVGQHDQPFVGTSRAYADTFLVGDDLFLREINTYAFEHAQAVAIRTLPFTESHAGILQLWDRVGLRADSTYYQDLTGPDSHTLQRVPAIDVWGQTQLGEHVLSDVRGEAVDFQRSRGAAGLRLDLEPGAMVPLPLGRFGFGAVHASVRETAYHLTAPEVTQTDTVLPRNQSRELLQLGGEVGTTLSRVYPFHLLGLEKLKHTLEPGLSYLYIPQVDQTSLPFFDGVDRIERRSLLTYGLVTRFLGKLSEAAPAEAASPAASPTPPGASVRELARFSLTQSFDVNREIDPLQAGRAADHFSDIDFAGRINPSRALSLRFLTNYDAGNNNISAAKLGVFVQDPRPVPSGDAAPRLDTRTSIGISYRVLTANLLQELDDSIVIRLTDWAGFLYSSRYDVVHNQFLDNYFGLRLISTCDCWALDFAVVDRTNPQEVQVTAQLTLVGLGSSKPQTRTASQP